MNQYELKIEKIKCQGCVDTVVKALNTLPNLNIISTNTDAKTIVLETSEEKSSIENKLSEIGFPAS